jgi:upstream activation factor subunit UAF30
MPSVQKEINDLILQRFDKFNEGREAQDSEEPPEPPPTAKPPTNGTTAAPKAANGTSSKKRSSPSPSDDEQDSELSSPANSPPPKKKHKKSHSVELSDAALAARLQAEENGRMARATRGGNSAKRKTLVKKGKKEPKKKKKKSKARVGSGDDSDLESGVEKKEVKRTGGFHVSHFLSTLESCPKNSCANRNLL